MGFKGPKIPKPLPPVQKVDPGEESARLRMLEKMNKRKASRASSRLTMPNMLKELEVSKPILADVMG